MFEIGGLELGHDDGPIRVLEWDPEEQELQSYGSVVNGRMLFGRDEPVPPTWRFRFRTRVQGGEAGAQAKVAQLVAAFRPDNLAPGEDVPLRYLLAGRWRRVYGRPQRVVAPSTDVLVQQGRADVPATFQLTEALHFDDAEQSVSLTSIPPTVGGLVAPIVAPITTAKNSEVAADSITVGGDTETPLRVVFRGPITDPWMTVGGIRIALSGRIAAGQTVTVDARARTVLRQDGASVAGMLSRTARMGQLRLPPGAHAVRYGGTGTARATVAWRNAWRTL
jgi:hypothetical protein